jgi:tungstate transport system ATP-binding protein
MTPVVALADIRVVRDGHAVLELPRLHVAPGEVLAIIGPNGAGKSSLLRVIGALEAPATGTVRFQGEAVVPGTALAVRRRMASVFQEPLLADTTVFDNVAMGLRFRGVTRAGRAARVARWLERLSIGELAGRRARTLSGGEAQRVALARALVVEPELLLLDEPFSALDQPTRESLLGDLGRILREERITTVFVTHDHEEAMVLADRVGVLMAGRLLQLDLTTRVFRSPASEEVARFVGVETLVEARVLASQDGVSVIEAGGQTMEIAEAAPVDEVVRLCLRAEDVSIKTGSPPAGAVLPTNRLKGTVARLNRVGLHVRVLVDCGFPLSALVTQRAVEELDLDEGVAVTVQFKSSAPHLLVVSKP